jgi:hypothetical protein
VATELCEGEPLDRLLRNGPIALDRAKAIVSQVGQALLEAQKAGIVHRDVSPKNILCAPSGDIKVINFAVAKPVTDKASGVAAYLSPEQVQGKPVDQRSNTYSLAAVLYHMLTGEPPFQGAPDAVLELHLSSPPLAPSQRRPEANLTPEVDRVLLKALDKSSSRRHLTLRLFLSEVEALIPAPVAPAPSSAGKEAGGVGFAKTMLFAGGQAEVANLVAKAIASRSGGAPGPATPGPAPAAPTAQPQMASPRASDNPVGIAATMAITPSAPAAGANGARAGDEFSENLARLTPPPVTPYPPTAQSARTPTPAASSVPAAAAAGPSAAAGGKGGGGKSGAFRETLWFKKGDVEHMIAEAKAKMAAQGKGPEGETPGDEVKPIEDRYVDDGSLTAEDRKKFSLRSGGTATAMPGAAGVVPGESMSEQDVIREVSGSRKGIVVAVAAVVIIAVAAVAVMMMSGRQAPAPPPAAPAVAVPAPPPTAPAAGVKPTPTAVVPAAAAAVPAKPVETAGRPPEAQAKATVTAAKKADAASEKRSSRTKKPDRRKKR